MHQIICEKMITSVEEIYHVLHRRSRAEFSFTKQVKALGFCCITMLQQAKDAD